MFNIKYRITYTGTIVNASTTDEHGIEREFVTVAARDINSGYAKALKVAREPLGNGNRREIGAIEFWST